MITYSEFRPTGFDCKGLGLEDRQEWLVLEISQNRDSDVLTRCNFDAARDALFEGSGGPGEFEVHRFGHWGPGWFEVILVKPGSKAEQCARELEAALADYPVLDDDRLSEQASFEADEAWQHERTRDRIAYIERNRSEFEFRSFADLLGCVRGRYFGGDALSYLGQY